MGPSWCYKDFCRFAEMLTLPEGGQLRLEEFQKLILRHVFEPGRVELLVMLPKGNGKTTLFAALAVFHLLTVKSARCYIGAADADQAGIMYGFAQHFVEAHPWLEKRLGTRPGTKEIRSRSDLGLIKVIASDSSKGKAKRQGPPVTLALIDELHAHDNAALYTALRSGAFKRQGIVLTITTAGWDQESTLGELRNSMLAFDAEGGTVTRDDKLTVAHSKSGRTSMLEWALRPEDDRFDPKVIKHASPASFVTVDSITDAMEAPGITPWDFARYFCNVWTLAAESWIPEGAWTALESDAEITGDTLAAVDMGRYRDCAAVVLMDRTGTVRARIWRSGGKDHPIPYAEVKDHIRELHSKHGLIRVAYDPKYFDQSAEELEAEGVPMTLFPQSNERMGLAAADLRRDILEANLTHDGDSELARHVAGAQARDIGEDAFKLVKSDKGPPVDGCIALAMANRVRVTLPVVELVPFEFA